MKKRPHTNPFILSGGLLLFLLLLLALTANLIAPNDPFKSVALPFVAPTVDHWFGTDDLGRDVFSGVIHGTRTSLLVGGVVASVSLILGVLVGSLAGSSSQWVDDLLMRLTELIQVMPRFFLALVVVALFGATLINLILVLALTYWPSTARLMRAAVLSVKNEEYVVAARSIGTKPRRILSRHILPNTLAPVIVHVSLQMGRAILVEAGLSFIGLGDPNVISWGYMLNNAQAFMRQAWWMSVFPGSAIALTVLGVNLLGDGLNAYWNPRISK